MDHYVEMVEDCLLALPTVELGQHNRWLHNVCHYISKVPVEDQSALIQRVAVRCGAFDDPQSPLIEMYAPLIAEIVRKVASGVEVPVVKGAQ